MSGICGFVGEGDARLIDAMLAAIPYRGDSTDVAAHASCALGYRWWSGRPGKSPGVHRDGENLSACAGTFAPSVENPAADLARTLGDSARMAVLDGAFAGAHWDDARKTLTLVRDPFGVRSLYYTRHKGVFYFASELKQLLAIPDLPVEADYVALHKYLTFSFVPGEDVPVKGIKRLLPGRVARFYAGELKIEPYFQLVERLDLVLSDRAAAVAYTKKLLKDSVARRLGGESEVGLALSGGLDSSAVAVLLKEAGVKVSAFSLDFGAQSVERDQAREVAKSLEIPLTWVPFGVKQIEEHLPHLVWKLDLPFGDPVTGPQYVLAQSARQSGLTTLFNGEGGDQLFGGWTSKPMISAQLYSGLYEDQSREEMYLKSYHRFYGLEEQLYTEDFKAKIGSPGQRRALLKPYLESGDASTFLNRVRFADIGLKGSQNILPRAERAANGWGLDVRVPLFDRALAEGSFRMPPQMKLHGACEKYVMKLSFQKRLPKEIVWRRKFGMSVPVTDWILKELEGLSHVLLGPETLARRGLFWPDYVQRLRQGQNDPQETRRRRIGERLWTLMMLEAWMRVFIDGRGKEPGGVWR